MKIKIFVGISILCFFVITTSVLAGYKIISDRSKGSDIKNSSKFGQLIDNLEVKNNEQGSAGNNQDGTITTAVDASSHNTPTDCWIIISGKIYDVTSFLNSHPGGSLVITPYCGKDATYGFETKDKKPPSKHSALALQILAQYFVANVGDKVTTKIPSGTTTNTVPGNILPTLKPGVTIPPTTTTNTPSLQNSTTTLSTAEVANHNTASNCWLIISNNVYNVSSYIVQHPGGVSVIQAYCGKEATQAFQTKGGTGNNHSNYAYSLLNNFLVGSIGSTLQTSSVTPTAAPGGGTTTTTKTPSPTTTPVTPTATTPPLPPSTTTLSATEVANHNTASNCWLIISNNVYNVSSYIVQHPGGVSVIQAYCGKEATQAFQTKGGRGSNHSNYAYSLLNNYLVGTIGSSIPSPTTAPGSGGTTTTPAPTTATGGGSTGSSNLPASVSAKYPGATLKSIEDDQREMEILYNGSCRHIKVNSSGAITSDQAC